MMKKIISGKTEIYAILGDPICHSLSPIIHNEAFKIKDLDKVFIALKTNNKTIKLAIEAIRNFNLKGLSVTMPLKELIIEYLDDLSNDAKIIGAVNCVVNNKGLLVGYNTDGKGFSLSLKDMGINNLKNVFVIGAGGVAKAIVLQLMLENVKNIFITNRHIDRLKTVEAKLKGISSSLINIIEWDYKEWSKVISRCDLIVNATSLGMKDVGDLSAMIPWEVIDQSTIIYDTVYEPLETKLIKKSKSLNLKAINGINLLIYQASISFNIWTKEEFPIAFIKNQISSSLEGK
jgi:shikimate dehydrogenase